MLHFLNHISSLYLHTQEVHSGVRGDQNCTHQLRHIKGVGSRKMTSSILFSISFLMAPKFCWLFQLLHNELMISEKRHFIHIAARYPTGIPPVTSILRVPPMICFCGGHVSVLQTKRKKISRMDHPIQMSMPGMAG